jgi:hypothetical protein
MPLHKNCKEFPSKEFGAKKSQATPGSFDFFAKSRLSGFSFNDRFFSHFRLIQHLDKGHRRIVTLPETALQNTQVTTVARCITRADFAEQLTDDFTIAKTVKGQTTVCETRRLAQRNDSLGNTAQFLSLR